jgi:hypothetical protein
MHHGKLSFVLDADQVESSSGVYIARVKVNEAVRYLRIVEADRNE